jgi:hypothetical protein
MSTTTTRSPLRAVSRMELSMRASSKPAAT